MANGNEDIKKSQQEQPKTQTERQDPKTKTYSNKGDKSINRFDFQDTSTTIKKGADSSPLTSKDNKAKG